MFGQDITDRNDPKFGLRSSVRLNRAAKISELGRPLKGVEACEFVFYSELSAFQFCNKIKIGSGALVFTVNRAFEVFVFAFQFLDPLLIIHHLTSDRTAFQRTTI